MHTATKSSETFDATFVILVEWNRFDVCSTANANNNYRFARCMGRAQSGMTWEIFPFDNDMLTLFDFKMNCHLKITMNLLLLGVLSWRSFKVPQFIITNICKAGFNFLSFPIQWHHNNMTTFKAVVVQFQHRVPPNTMTSPCQIGSCVSRWHELCFVKGVDTTYGKLVITNACVWRGSGVIQWLETAEAGYCVTTARHKEINI